MYFYLLQLFGGSSKAVQFAVLGSFLSYLKKPGFDFASLFYLQAVLFIINVREAPSHFLSMMSSLFFFLYGVSTSP